MKKYHFNFNIQVLLIFLIVSCLFYSLVFKSGKENDSQKETTEYFKDNLIFVGGYGRSGTTLIRAILDSHSNIRCGPETKLIPRLLNFMTELLNEPILKKQLEDSSLSRHAADLAIGSFIRTIILNNGKKANRYCNKDPYTVLHIKYLAKLFPNSKFIVMIRDIRAVSYSYVKNIIKDETNLTIYETIIFKWNLFINNVVQQCTDVGQEKCMIVYYEKLVLNPEKILKVIMNFIGEKWENSLLNHEKYIGEEIVVSKSEWSSQQIKNPINMNAINSWSGKLPTEIFSDIKNLAPMLKALGYDPFSNTSVLLN